MKHRILAATMALTLSLTAVPTLLAAPIKAITPSMHAKFGDAKTIKFSLRNDSKEVLTLQAGEQQIVLQPGKSSNLKIAEGTQIITVNATPNHAAGGVISTVSTNLSGNTLVVN